MLTDGRWNYTWNAVNRLTKMEANSTVGKRYAWGIDFSGTTQGAGGVGGLLMVNESSTTYLSAHDGRANVAALINAADGTVAAAYEYTPYGELVRQSGSYAATNPFRYSSKFTDNETGLVYYGRRYYDPAQGRFLGRDPIEEQGGLNLYGFCGNNSVNRWDLLGQASNEEIISYLNGNGSIDTSGWSQEDWNSYTYYAGEQGAQSAYQEAIDGHSPYAQSVSGSGGSYGAFTALNQLSNWTIAQAELQDSRSAPNSVASTTNVVGTIFGHSALVVAEHGNIRIYPDNPDAIDRALAAYGFEPTLKDANGQRYVVFSGGPDYAKGTDSVLGNLGGNVNDREWDWATKPNTRIGTISAPPGVSRDQFTLTLIANTANYNNGNKTDYDLLPPFQNGYNSNSYFTGLSSSAGGTINTSLSWRFIGSGQPLPASSFAPSPNPGGPEPYP